MAKVEIRIKESKEGPWLKELFATLNFFNGGLGTIEEQANDYCVSLAVTTGNEVGWNLEGFKEGNFIDPQA